MSEDLTAAGRAFQVDLRGVVDLLARHLYSGPRVYVRELLQNGVDAITARRLHDADAPARVQDLAYESRLRSSFASAQGFQGPLDGGWTLAVAGEGDLYALELVDRARGEVEGAWRDLRRKGALAGSGFVDDIVRSGGDLTLRFTPEAGGASATATLRGGYGDSWTGELDEGGRKRPATLRRTR